MTLTALAETLRKQAQNGAIVLNEDVLAGAELDHIAALFLLGTGKRLTVSGVKPADVPDPAGNALRIAAGTVSVFGANNVTPTLVFTLDDKGAATAIRHQINGRERPGVRADEARTQQVMASVEATAKRVKEQKPRADTEGAMRELLTGIATGQPNYERMTPSFADLTRQQLSWMRDFIGNLGAIKKLTFNRVGPEGGDVYDVEFEKDTLHVDLRFSDDNRIDYVRLLPN